MFRRWGHTEASMVLSFYTLSILFCTLALATSKVRRDATFVLRSFPIALC